MSNHKDPTDLLKELLSKSRTLMNMGEYEKGVDVFNKILKINPYLPDVWVLKGSALQLLKDYDEAMKCYDEALRLDPTNTKAQLGKGSIETGLKIHPPRNPHFEFDLATITKKIKTIINDKLKNDPLFQIEFKVSKEGG